MNLLENINGHGDLKQLDHQQRLALCDEIRQFLIDHVSKTGGHLASNLGVVELTVALETVFDTENDRLVFDVGHQAYVHKLLTGRREEFDHLRQFGGIAGFPKPSESHSDAFVAGHASSSVSIALGMARARTLQNKNHHVIALLGDGAATGGMAYEGLNDAGDSKEPMIVILNDNEMSIDRNVGGLSRHLYRLRVTKKYLGMKDRYRKALKGTSFGKWVYLVTRNIKNWVKHLLLPVTMFENMGFTYYGPVDGHDLETLIDLFSSCKDMEGPILIHVLTQKGRGFAPAEENPAKFHGIGRFDPESGETVKAGITTFSDTFGKTMVELAADDNKICAITAAMPGGTGLLNFKKTYPERLFDVGIAEEHAVSMAGGLAKQGMKPVVALYSTFLQRSYDQILQDVAMLKLPVVLAVDRAGLVGEDGETHHGVFDVGFLRHAPGMTILAPASCAELQQMLTWAVKESTGPVAVRYPRGGNGSYSASDFDPEMNLVCHRCGADGAIVTYGTLVNNALDAAEILSNEGLEIAVYRLTRLENAEICLPDVNRVLIAEEAIAGMAAELAYNIQENMPHAVVQIADLGKEYVTHGSVSQLYRLCGLDAAALAEKMKGVIRHEN